ncbi:MAG: hypothetical protein R3305_06730 [Gammaproteobacteria bacterium]|nr:hypothetical protein [Gammaproteobacteria bacterium]
MKRSVLTAYLVLTGTFASSPAALAQTDPVGWWRATTETPNGEVSTTLRLDYFDGELSGTFRNTFISAQLPIFDSVLDGNRVTFKLQLQTRVLEYEGEIDGDELTLSSWVIEGEPFPGSPEVSTIVLTRSE